MPEAFRQAVALQQQGQLAQAERLYQTILKRRPDHFDALHLLGIVRCQQARYDEAVVLLRRALKMGPASAAANCNLGNALQALNRHDEAIASYDRALAIEPDHAESLNNRGSSQQALNRRDEALASYDRALAVQPGYVEALYNRGNALQDSGRHDAAVASYDKALALRPDFADAFNNRGVSLQALNRHDAAVASYDKALALRPDFADALNNRGVSLQDLYRHEEALTSYDKAIAIKPDYVDALSNRAVSLMYLNRHDAAIAGFEKALALDPDYVGAHWNFSMILLNVGRFREGWEEYEWRWRYYKTEARRYDFAVWSGEVSKPCRLLLWGEQGIGDEIIYAGMVADLVSSPLSITLETDPRLVPLFQRSFPQVAVVPRQNPPALDPADFDCQTPLASLGRWLRPSFESFPRHAGYLVADPSRVEAYKSRLHENAGGASKVIGISWRSLNAELGSFKSMELIDWAGILRQPNAHCVDLQYGDTAGERAVLERQSGVNLEHLQDLDLFNDLEGLAALCGACDLVITVSNVTAHVAGALGRPVWLLTPQAKGKIWYWYNDRNDSPWYPSMRIFTQQTPGNWREVLDVVARELAAFVGNRS